MKDVMNVHEVADVVGVHVETVRKWLAKGEMTGSLTPAGWRLTPTDIQAWLSRYRREKGQAVSPTEPDATTHLMSSPANAARLTQAINDHRAGRNMQEKELLPDVD